MTGLPPESTWIQYPIIAIITLVTALIAFGFYKLFRDLMSFIKEQNNERSEWMSSQDKAREIEREKQREWQADQDRVRDERWQSFLKSMQEAWLKQDGHNNNTVRELILRINELIDQIEEHDKFTREAIAAMRERTTRHEIS